LRVRAAARCAGWLAPAGLGHLTRRYFGALAADDELALVRAKRRATKKIRRYILWRSS
jgi:hypothetical protein